MEESSPPKSPFPNIEIVLGNSAPPEVAEAGPVRSDDEDWDLNFNSLKFFSQQRDWGEVLRVLVYLSNKDGHPDHYRAMAQAAWLVLKIEAPVTQVVLILYNLLVSLGPLHAASGPLASLANLMAKHRTPDHPERELAQVQARQMLRFVAEGNRLESAEEFQAWVVANHLDDPDQFLPPVLETLDAFIKGDWWFDHRQVLAELEAHAASRN